MSINRRSRMAVKSHPVVLMTLIASLFMFWSQRAVVAQTPSPSDSLFVNYGGVNNTFTIPQPAVEGNPEGIADSGGPFNPFLPKTGYVVILDPDGTTSSDILVSFTGSSLQLYSDGSPGFPTIASLQAAGLTELGRFTEGPNGITQNVGNLFGTTANPINANQITVFSDGNVPEPASLLLLGTGLLGVLGYRFAMTRAARSPQLG